MRFHWLCCSRLTKYKSYYLFTLHLLFSYQDTWLGGRCISSPLCKWIPCGKVLANGIWAEVVWIGFLGKIFKTVGQSQLAVSFLAFALSLGWPTVLVFPILWGFQRHGTFSLKAWTVPGEVGKLSLCLPFLQQNVNVMVGRDKFILSVQNFKLQE